MRLKHGNPAQREPMTLAEYVALEAVSDVRHEFIGGEIRQTSGRSAVHAAIATNILGGLLPRLRGKPCRPTNGDQRLYVPATDGAFYADVVVVCGQYTFAEHDAQAVTNPKVIVEVLSPTTADFDQGTKFQHYRRIESLEEYLLVHQDRRVVEQRVRLESGEWLMREVTEGAVQLRSIGVELPIDEVYDLEGVTSDPPPA